MAVVSILKILKLNDMTVDLLDKEPMYYDRKTYISIREYSTDSWCLFTNLGAFLINDYEVALEIAKTGEHCLSGYLAK